MCTPVSVGDGRIYTVGEFRFNVKENIPLSNHPVEVCHRGVLWKNNHALCTTSAAYHTLITMVYCQVELSSNTHSELAGKVEETPPWYTVVCLNTSRGRDTAAE